jgi:hypothetical protein
MWLFGTGTITTVPGVTNGNKTGITINYAYTPPPAPTGLTPSVSGNSVSLTWNSVSGASNYRVYRSASSNGPYTSIMTTSDTSYTDSGLDEGTYYYKVSTRDSSGSESPQSGSVSAIVEGSGGLPGGDALPGAKGKLTLTGFDEFNGSYVYSGLLTTSGKYLIGTNSVDYNGGNPIISMVRISGGRAEAPLYTANPGGTSLADIYVPYEGSESFQVVSVMIVNDNDGKFTASDATSFATNYIAMLGNNAMNKSFTPSTNNGSITIDRSEAALMSEIAQKPDAKYLLMVNPQ